MRTVASFVLVLAVGADALVACGATKQRTGAGHDRSTPDASHPALDAAAPRLDAANPPVDVELYGATVGSSPARVTRCTRHSINPCWCFMQAPSEAPFRASLGPEPSALRLGRRHVQTSIDLRSVGVRRQSRLSKLPRRQAVRV